MLCGHGRAVKLYGYINGKAVELTGNPAFNVEYERPGQSLLVEKGSFDITCHIAGYLSYYHNGFPNFILRA